MSRWQPIKTAIDYLAARCDGAHDEDGQGFNKPDSSKGKRLACLEAFDDAQARCAYDLIRKYVRQLGDGGIVYGALPVPPLEGDAGPLELPPYPGKHKERGRIISADGGCFVLGWSYADAQNMINASRELLPKKSYDRATKTWRVAQRDGARIMEFADAYGFEVSQAACDLFDNLATLPPVEDPPNASSKAAQYPDRIIRLGMSSKRGDPVALVITGNFVKAVYDIVKPLGTFTRDPIAAWALEGKDAATVLKLAEDYHFNVTAEAQAWLENEKAKLERANGAANRRKLALLAAAADIPHGNFGGKKPRDYQIAGISLMLEGLNAYAPGSGVILADQMGLGKTFEAMLFARCFQRAFGAHVFIVCPVSLMRDWAKEAAACNVTVNVFSWAKIPKPVDSPFIVIADEAHYMQEIKSQRTKAALELAQHEQCLAFLPATGTPMRGGRPKNIFPILRAIKHPLAENKRDFERYYCNARMKSVGRGREVWDVTGSAHLDELMSNIGRAFVSRKKEEVLKDLPPKVITIKSVDISPTAQAIYDQAFNEAKARYEAAKVERLKVKARLTGGEYNPNEEEGSEAIVLLGILRRAASVAMVEATCAMIEESIEQGQYVMAYSEFPAVLAAIKKHFEGQGIGCEVLTGSTEGDERPAMVARFQSGKSRVFCLTKAGGVGITLTRADVGILIDQPWMVDDANQIIDRLHRKDAIMEDKIKAGVSCVFGYWLKGFEIHEKIQARLAEQEAALKKVDSGARSTMRGVKSIQQIAKEVARELFERAK